MTLGVTTSVEALSRRLALFLLALLGAEDTPPIPLDQQIALIGAALAQQPALLCFDDLHLVREDVAILALLRHLLTTTPTSLLLISREEVPLPGVMSMRLAGLDRAEGLALVDRLVTHTPGASSNDSARDICSARYY